MSFLALALASAVFAQESCLMAPPREVISLPKKGIAGACRPSEWTRRASGKSELFVSADGPEGSGHFWSVAVGLSRAGGAGPERAVCLTPSTVGWRTLQGFEGGGLRWIDDADGDGRAELILWGSFSPAGEDAATNADQALAAWVYRPGLKGALALDWELSRAMARRIAAAYRTPSPAPGLAALRGRAAEALERFAGRRCAVTKKARVRE